MLKKLYQLYNFFMNIIFKHNSYLIKCTYVKCF